MAYKTPDQLKARFEGGDVPTQQDFADFIGNTHLEFVNVKAFGAKGNGSTDDTTAITAAWAVYDDQNNRRQEQPGEWADGDVLLSPTLYFPPGDYIFNGPALSINDNFVKIKGAGNRQIRIRLADDIYLVETDQVIFETDISDMTISGGKGLFRHTRTGTNTHNYHSFKRLNLLGYTECGIGSLSSNMPKWNVQDCTFYGTSTSIGLVLPKQVAQGTITHNSFDNNKYHLKLPLDDSLHVIGPNNTYLRAAGTGIVEADVWLVGAGTGSDNRGDGLTFFGERFSNENFSNGDMRILIAEEDTGSGADAMTRDHATTDANGYVAAGIRFSHCGFGADGDPSSTTNKGVVFTYLANTGPIKFIENYISGGYFPYWLEFASGLTPTQTQLTRLSEVRGSQIKLETAKPLACNVDGYVNEIQSDYGYRGRIDDFDIIPGADYQYEDVLGSGADPNNWGLGSGGGIAPTRGSVTDVYGGAEAAEFTFADESGNTQAGLTETNLIAGEVAWIECDVRKGTTTSLTSVRMFIQEAGGTAHTVKEVSIHLTDDWRRVRIPWTVNEDKSNLTLRFNARNRYTASTNKFRVGRAAVYRGNAPSFGRHVATTGINGGGWDGAHLVLGSNHLWVDATGDLRIHTSAPTTDLDGTVVGTQT